MSVPRVEKHVIESYSWKRIWEKDRRRRRNRTGKLNTWKKKKKERDRKGERHPNNSQLFALTPLCLWPTNQITNEKQINIDCRGEKRREKARCVGKVCERGGGEE